MTQYQIFQQEESLALFSHKLGWQANRSCRVRSGRCQASRRHIITNHQAYYYYTAFQIPPTDLAKTKKALGLQRAGKDYETLPHMWVVVLQYTLIQDRVNRDI